MPRPYVDDLKPSESEPPDGSTTATPEGPQSRDGREVLADLNPAPRGSGQLLLYGQRRQEVQPILTATSSAAQPPPRSDDRALRLQLARRPVPELDARVG